MEDHEKVLIDVLQKEFIRVMGKSLANDEWHYKLLSVGIIPFLLFLGYCAANPNYRILVAALPFISIIGILTLAILGSHYIYATFYGKYLENRINTILKGEELLDSHFTDIIYHGSGSIVFLAYALSLILLIVLNLAAYPIIDATIIKFYQTHHAALGRSAFLLKYYWQFNALLLILVLAIWVVSYKRSMKKARKLLENCGS